jgi:hypothetical protein
MVNSHDDSSSSASGNTEDSRGPHQGDLFVGNFGDVIKNKQNNTLRIGFQNVGGFPINKGKIKEDNIRIGLTKWDFDIFGCAEVNLDWRLIPEVDKLLFRTKEWWDAQHVSWAHNRNNAPSLPHQYGGTAIFSINQAAHRAIEKDKSGLGRWTWTKYQGKKGQTLRVIAGYRPNPPQGPHTVYAQQNAFFHSIRRDICPRRAFLDDLVDQITEFIDKGDHVLLILDGNYNMKNSDFSKALQQLTMEKVILKRHGLNGPATYKRNLTNTPIDGIWATQGICIENGGYFAYEEVIMNTDHRCLWVDIPFSSIFGHSLPPSKRRNARRLHCKDPRLVENFIRLYHQFAAPLKLFERVNLLEINAKHMSKSQLIEEYEELDSIRCQVTASAEAKCRKLRTGQVAFSPELNEARSIIKAWSLLVNKAKGQKVSSRMISRALKKTTLPTEVIRYKETLLQEKLKEAYQSYYRIKGNAKELRQSALENLAEAIAASGSPHNQPIRLDTISCLTNGHSTHCTYEMSASTRNL